MSWSEASRSTFTMKPTLLFNISAPEFPAIPTTANTPKIRSTSVTLTIAVNCEPNVDMRFERLLAIILCKINTFEAVCQDSKRILPFPTPTFRLISQSDKTSFLQIKLQIKHRIGLNFYINTFRSIGFSRTMSPDYI